VLVGVLPGQERRQARPAQGGGHVPVGERRALGRQPVDVVLDAVKKVSTADKTYELYRYIYRYSWAILDRAGRMVLVDMSVFPPLTGGTVADVESVSQVASREFWSAIDQLVRLSLVDKGGVAGQERYFLHPLTWNFIRSDITKEEEWIQ